MGKAAQLTRSLTADRLEQAVREPPGHFNLDEPFDHSCSQSIVGPMYDDDSLDGEPTSFGRRLLTFLRGFPRSHIEFHFITALAVGAALIRFAQLASCSDEMIVGKASELLHAKAADAWRVSLFLVKQTEGSEVRLSCSALARLEYRTKDNRHLNVRYDVSMGRSGGVENVTASFLPDLR